MQRAVVCLLIVAIYFFHPATPPYVGHYGPSFLENSLHIPRITFFCSFLMSKVFALLLKNIFLYVFRFSLKQKNGKDGDGEVQTVEVTVYDYFVNYRHIDLRYSGDMPCINVGKPKRPTYIPLEVNDMLSGI